MEALVSETLVFGWYNNSVYLRSACPIAERVNYPVPFCPNYQLVFFII
jgi:hypothetical protein